jgi:hypothetical protein
MPVLISLVPRAFLSSSMNETIAANRTIVDGLYDFGIDMINDPLGTLKQNPVFVIIVTLLILMPFILKQVFPEYKKVFFDS